MDLEVIHDDDDLRFYANTGEEDAELTYTYTEDDVLDFDYTYVPEDHRGQGVADKLVKAGLDFVKGKNYKFIASCPVVEAYVKRHPEYEPFMQEV